MCGIFFAINNNVTNSHRVKKFMQDAMLASQVRGMDGFGLAVVGGTTKAEKDEPYVYKTSLSATMAYDTQGTEDGLKRVPDCNLALGHVRAATEGVVSTENSHPFRIFRPDGSNIIGVHNGTLRNWKNHKDASRFNVDSHWALHMIATHGAKAFEYFIGAYAFVWWDSKTPDKVYMARNSERPLNFMVDQSNNLMVGASEAGMLGWIAERNGIVITKKPKLDAIMYLKTETLFTFDMKNVGSFETETLPKYDYKHLSPPTNLVPYKAPRFDSWQDRHSWGNWGGYSYKYDQPVVLAGVKKAIADARRRLAEAKVDSEIVDEEILEKRLFKAIEEVTTKYHKSESIPATAFDNLSKPYHLLKPNVFSATKGEVKAARKKQVFGQVVNFIPIDYEKHEQVLLGEFTITIDNKRIKAIGELRHDITEAKARNLIDSEMPILTSIIGVVSLDLRTDSEDDDKDIYIVSNLTGAQRTSAIQFAQSKLN